MSALIPWSLFRPGTEPRPCPRCGARPEDPVVVVRHELARFAGHAPAWVICRPCAREYAVGIANGRRLCGAETVTRLLAQMRLLALLRQALRVCFP